MFCKNCGTQLIENDNFCPKCGQTLKKDNETKNRINRGKGLYKIFIPIILVFILVPISVFVVYPKIKPIIENQNKKEISNNEIKSIYDNANKQIEQTGARLSLFLVASKMGGKTQTVSELKLVETFEEDSAKLDEVYKQMDSFRVPSQIKEHHNLMIKSLKDIKYDISNIIELGKNNKNKLESEFIISNLSHFDNCANAIKEFKDKYTNINTQLK
ncbi:zinc ribbon domain-containing protein [Clostridium tunisiense]|uniref:zinc ribbon domain-containing protein n=1 Tax=Clostridium tunisiense TaxID=219748 RepID=UPI0002D490B4|nr:zinc ribbon domain-containing protein [Clostridium tunisiense]